MTAYATNDIKYYKIIDWSQPINPSGITATSGWENPKNAFDGNSNTYARCNTLTDYIEYDLGTEIFLTGMTAQGCQVNSQAVATDLKIFKVDEAGKETLLGTTTGQANTCPYNLTTTFTGVWVKKIRIRITVTYSGAPCRILQINLTANKQKVIGTAEDFDEYILPEITQIYNGSQNISYVYKGNQLLFQDNPYEIEEILANQYQQAGSIELYGGTYELKIVSSGGSGTHSAGYWFNSYASGGSGAVWEGTFKYSGPSRLLSWTAPVFPNGDIVLSFGSSTWLTLTGGKNATNGGGPNNGGVGGILTIDTSFSSLIQVTTISTNGTKGDGFNINFGSGASDITPTSSTLGWGIGSNSSNNGGTGGGIYLKRIA